MLKRQLRLSINRISRTPLLQSLKYLHFGPKCFKSRPSMQSFTIVIFPLAILTSLFSQNYAVITERLHKSDRANFSKYYARMRENSVHRGVLLSKSLEEQNKICHNLLSPTYTLVKEIVYADEELIRMKADLDWPLPRVQKSHDSIDVFKLIDIKTAIAEEELFIVCYAMNVQTQQLPLQIMPFYVFSAFDTNEFHLSEKDYWNDRQVDVFRGDYEVSMPAEYVPGSTFKVEERYIEIRQILDYLKQESPRYVELIEARDDISVLSVEEKSTVCASILGTHYFMLQNIVFDTEWADRSGPTPEIDPKRPRPLNIGHRDYENEKLSVDTVLCRAWDTVSNSSKYYHYMRSYDNRNSVFVAADRNSDPDPNGPLQFDSYFEKIPLLMKVNKSI